MSDPPQAEYYGWTITPKSCRVETRKFTSRHTFLQRYDVSKLTQAFLLISLAKIYGWDVTLCPLSGLGQNS